MSARAAAALAAMGHANLALCHYWVRVFALTFEHAHQLTKETFEAFVERQLVAADAITVRANAVVPRGVCESGSAGPWAVSAGLFRLPHGLPCLIAEYAGDMNPIAEAR